MPNPDPLCDESPASDGFWASGGQHLVQNRDADGRFGLLGGKATCSRPRSDQRLVAAHRRFDERAPAIVRRCLPSQSALFRDRPQMAITLCGPTRLAAGQGRRARRNHHFDVIAMSRDGPLGGDAIIRAVRRHPGYRIINPIE